MFEFDEARSAYERQSDLARLRGLRPIDDDSHILYVNGAYRGDSDIGKLMHDFSCTDPGRMNYPLMEEVTRYYKETQEGVEYMCKAFEEVREEGYKRGMQQGMQQAKLISLRNLMFNLGLSSQQAMEALSIPKAEQETYAALLKQ